MALGVKAMAMMSNPRAQSVERLRLLIADLSLGQTILLFLWVLSLLIHKLADAASSLLWKWFFEYLIDEAAGDFGLTSPQDDSADSLQEDLPCSRSDGEEDVEDASNKLIVGSLFSALPDEIVEEHIWPTLASFPELLPRLCSINKQWRAFVHTTLAWSTLTFIVSDSQMLHEPVSVYLARHWEIELAHFRILLAEDYMEIEARVSYSGFTIRSVPSYVSIEGLPPDVEKCLGYYDL